mgnify:CR=1 FL=1
MSFPQRAKVVVIGAGIVGNSLGVYYEAVGGPPLPWSSRDIGATGTPGAALTADTTSTTINWRSKRNH